METDGRPDKRYETTSRSSHSVANAPTNSHFYHTVLPTYVSHTTLITNINYFPKQHQIATNTILTHCGRVT